MFNAQAKAALPQLVIGRSLSFAVRSPEVVSAVERVLREGAVAETEFHEKVPVERSFEVRATPVRIDAAPSRRRGRNDRDRDVVSRRHRGAAARAHARRFRRQCQP